MLRKVRFILVFVSLSICLGLMSSTYSRYIADTNGDIDVLFAKWQILVNNNDITSGGASTIAFTPIVEANDNVKNDTVAPSSTGYFDIEIDPANVDVSFKYTINLSVENQNMPDLLISKYALLPTNYVNGDPLTYTNITDGTITNTLSFDNNTPDFAFDKFTIRVFFEWFEGTGEQMNDTDDTSAGYDAATQNTNFNMNANINFEQVF